MREAVPPRVRDHLVLRLCLGWRHRCPLGFVAGERLESIAKLIESLAAGSVSAGSGRMIEAKCSDFETPYMNDHDKIPQLLYNHL